MLAVQNGGNNAAFDFSSSKATTVRVGFDPAPGLHFSLSGIRTGRMPQTGDVRAELWFGNDWIRRRSGSVATNFRADAIGGGRPEDLPLRAHRGERGTHPVPR